MLSVYFDLIQLLKVSLYDCFWWGPNGWLQIDTNYYNYSKYYKINYVIEL